MKFQVPQFVEVEDKIFWTLTLKQFIYLAGGAGMVIIILLFVPSFFFAVILAAPIAALALALAFYKHNNRPFIVLLEAATKYLFNTRLYIWRKVETPITPTAKVVEDTGTAFMPKLSNSKLKDMNWALDTRQAQTPARDE